MDTIFTVLSSAAIAAPFAAGLVLIARRSFLKMFEKWVDVKAEKTIRMHNEQMVVLAAIHQHCLNAIPAFPQLIGKTRNACRAVLECNGMKEEDLTRLRLAIDELESALHTYTLILPTDTYADVHRFKEAARLFLRCDSQVDPHELNQLYRKLQDDRENTLRSLRDWTSRFAATQERPS